MENYKDLEKNKIQSDELYPSLTFRGINIENRQKYPELMVPPVAQAQMQENQSGEKGMIYALNYSGRNIITIELLEDVKAIIRRHSDGTVQSMPMIQQFFISTESEVKAIITLSMRKDAINMRPRRAQRNEAILAQVGRPLLYGVNGFYGIWEDLLLEWYGAEWQWIGENCTVNGNGSVSAQLEIALKEQPFIILIRQRYYGQHLGYSYHVPWKYQPNRKALSGWCSWEAYHTDVTEDNIADASKLMGSLVPYGLEYIQLDDGYENETIPPEKNGKVYESWINLNTKFPGGHNAITECIRKNGLKPAIWTNAVISNREAAATGMCFTENGVPIEGDWIKYIFDCTDKNLDKHVLPYYRKLKEYGYTYFKSDALRHLLFDGMQECVRRGLISDEEADTKYRAFFETARKGIGEDTYFLSCWGALMQAVGIADGCRIATDANPNWWAVLMQVMETARWFFAQRILFTIDPDHICVRMELEWARMLLTLVSLTGGIYMISDPLNSYDESRLEIIRKTLPSLCSFTAETGAVNYTTPAFCRLVNNQKSPEQLSCALLHTNNGNGMFGSLWTVHFHTGGRRWAVAARTALLPLDGVDMPLENLGLNPSGKYAVYDFWEEKYLGVITGCVFLKSLEIGHVQACSLTPVTDNAPALVGSTRHVSMDAISVISCVTGESSLVIKLSGISGESFRYCIYSAVPCRINKMSNCETNFDYKDGAYWLTVLFREGEAEIEILQF